MSTMVRTVREFCKRHGVDRSFFTVKLLLVYRNRNVMG